MDKPLAQMSRKEFVYECASRALAGVSLAPFLRAQSFRLTHNLGAILKVYVNPSKNCNNECGSAWKTRRARPEGHICCALSLGKGTTLPVATKHNSCALQATLSTQERGQRHPSFSNPTAKPSIASMVRDADKLWDELQEWEETGQESQP